MVTMTTRDSLRATLVAIVWGVNFVVLVEGLKGFPPFLLLSFRFLLVAFPLMLFVPRPAPWRTIVVIGTFMSLGQFTLVYLALHLRMPAGLSSLILQAQVMFTIVIARVGLGERASRRQVAGVLLGLLGLVVVALGYGEQAPLMPLILTLGAALSWALGNTLVRQAKIESGFGLVVWSGVLVPIPALAMALLVNGPHAIGHALMHVGWVTIGSTLYTVLCASLFGYGVWNSLLSRHSASEVVPFTMLVPVAGILSAWVVLGQAPTVTEMLGGVALVSGVATATLRRADGRRGASSGYRCPASELPGQ
jgi:O-acetylserine/cysteine efflux transporter